MPIENLKYVDSKRMLFFNLVFVINILSPYTMWAYYLQMISLLLMIIFLKGNVIILDLKTIFIITAILVSFLFSLFWHNKLC